MGVSRSINELVGKLDAAARDIDKAGTRGVKASAALVVASVNVELAKAKVHGRLTHVGRNGAAVGVRAIVKGDTAIVRMYGPAQLIENDTKAHAIPRDFVPGSRRRKPKTLKLADGGFRVRIAKHPGTTGKHPFAHGVDDAIPFAEAEFALAAGHALREAFK